MSHDHPMELFLELYTHLPRQGPGDAQSTRRAFALVSPPPDAASHVLDLGCGSGTQTLELAKLTPAKILGVDMHEPFITGLNQTVQRLGIADRVRAQVGDMGKLTHALGAFDLIWAEGSIYNVGFAHGLEYWQPFLAPGGHVAVTEACWLKPNPPAPCFEFWDREYPAITDVPTCLDRVCSSGYTLVGHFTVPALSWWTDYYGPLQAAIEPFRKKYASDPDAQAVADRAQIEIDMWHAYQDWYGYVFFVMRT